MLNRYICFQRQTYKDEGSVLAMVVRFLLSMRRATLAFSCNSEGGIGYGSFIKRDHLKQKEEKGSLNTQDTTQALYVFIMHSIH